jgi:RNA polymerase sigma factor (sigma-70 family)
MVIREGIRSTALKFNERLAFDYVEDLVQEVFLRVWKYQAEDKLSRCTNYIRRMAVNVTIDAILKNRAKKRMGGIRGAAAWALPSTHTPEDILLAQEDLRLRLTQCRALLTKRAYRAFVLVCIMGFARKEAASIVGLRPRTIDNILSQVRKECGQAV